MCLAYPIKVVEVNKDEAIVDYGGEFRKVMALDNVSPGDFVLVQNGIIIEVVNKEAKEFLKEHGC
ncbi:HypC/HybG/HupF family hydrogenase formation chaperone [archaeon]|jgi:hydrogenase assembly chaperone HypC/HupF|nr:HypC/HybG/HupF family hydrogenase formation chaperone [archaeon]MBT4397093.1 HypC/HybG/HupF family hydrogenase formation chaperone [archaeon]MBT4441180.1 HypC/HybG/HupF family hydrogenase formation chaperone [archaeon]